MKLLGLFVSTTLIFMLYWCRAMSFATRRSTTFPAGSAHPVHRNELAVLPELIVFDLDHCLWLPEMYTLDEIPSKTVIGSLHGHGDGAVAAKSGREEIKLFPDALRILQEIHNDAYPNVRIAAASSADTPHAVKIAKAAMELLEILPGVTMREVFNKGWVAGFDGNIQIGRTPPLSSDKSKTHFPLIKTQTGIDYNKMIFFDDCLWSDNCGEVERRCRGVVVQRTPSGLTVEDWNNALQNYSKKYGDK